MRFRALGSLLRFGRVHAYRLPSRVRLFCLSFVCSLSLHSFSATEGTSLTPRACRLHVVASCKQRVRCAGYMAAKKHPPVAATRATIPQQNELAMPSATGRGARAVDSAAETPATVAALLEGRGEIRRQDMRALLTRSTAQGGAVEKGGMLPEAMWCAPCSVGTLHTLAPLKFGKL